MDRKRYRVAQWATGHTGMRSLRGIIQHPDYELAGVYVYSEAKAGCDAGDLCGLATTGIIATRSIDDIIAARPDCVIYMPMSDGARIDDICRLLASGANIVTVMTEFHHPGSLDPETRGRIEEACRRGGTSLYATGPSPGFSTEIMPLAFSALQRRLDRIKICEFADMATRKSPEMIAKMFGADPAEMDFAAVAERLGRDMGMSLRLLADALGMPLDEVTATGAVAAATRTVTLDTATIPAGSVGAWRFEVTGWREGKAFLMFCPTWYITRDIDQRWDLRDTGWHVVIEGDAPLEIDVRLATENYGSISASYNANICVNAVANVCEAPPGIRTTADLPPIIARFG
ncbi:MAG TPA: dihydrodipicolinate reductase [Sphingobium sp.]|nr:dihydrodipicolinate reductase [Sphingobium sp.]